MNIAIGPIIRQLFIYGQLPFTSRTARIRVSAGASYSYTYIRYYILVNKQLDPFFLQVVCFFVCIALLYGSVSVSTGLLFYVTAFNKLYWHS